MSRTDKDAPNWVRADWWQPWHLCAGHHRHVRQRNTHGCDLPAEPVIERSPWRRSDQCRWVPVIGRGETLGRNRRGGHPPRWFVGHVWNNRDRTHVRDQLRRAIAEFHANGEVTVAPNIDQHRRCARWLWE